MSIVLTPAVPLLDQRQYFHTKQDFLCTLNPIQTGEICVFGLFNCDIPIPQFIDITDPNDNFKNDFYTFIFQVSENYTVEAVIENLSTGVTNTIVDNTFGVFNDVGDISNRPLVWNFKTDWNGIHAGMGFGKYIFHFTIKNSSGTIRFEGDSPCFDLKQFDCDEAHGTVRIETTQTGYIVNGFDYRKLGTGSKSGSFIVTSLGWRQQIRWYGQLSPDIPDEESDFLQDARRKEFQIQQKITEKFKLRLDFMRSSFGQNIIKDQFLADKILISDYNLSNYEVYRNKNLRKVSTDEINWHRLQQSIQVIWTFKDTDEGTVKRIFG